MPGQRKMLYAACDENDVVTSRHCRF